MKTFPQIASRHWTAWLPIALIGALLVGCNRSAPVPAATAAAPTSVAANTPPAAADAIYTCPMHPHIQQHGPGQCPICGMTMEKREVPAAAASEPAAEGRSASAPAASTEDRRILYYYDPMRPEVHFDKPGPSPFMDMDLLPKYAEAEAADAGVAVSAAVVQTLGIRTASPERREARPQVRVPARVVADARGQVRLQARVEGWIERLRVRAPGQTVTAGEVIAEIYAPELAQAQEELLLGADTAGPARERLRRLGIGDTDIEAVRRAGKASRRLPLRAPVGGVVTELGVREGSRVTADALIADIAGRNAVWVEAQLFPAQLAQLGGVTSARFSLPGVAGAAWRSEVGTRVPLVDPMTQTLAVRFAIDAAADLALGSVLDAEIEGEPRTDVLLVPASAVIRGVEGDRVVRALADGRFLPTAVQLGERYGDAFEVVDGLALSDRIVVSGQFLLDAEASLNAGLAQMQAAPAADSTP